MINESNLLNFYCTGVYDSTKALTETEIIMKVLEKINLVILNFNNLESQTLNNMKKLEKQIDYYLDSGMRLEVTKKIDEMGKDGTFEGMINEILLYDINNQITDIKEEIEILKQKIDTNDNIQGGK